MRRRHVVLSAVVLALAVVLVSYVSAMLRPSSLPLGVRSVDSEMSFSCRVDGEALEWAAAEVVADAEARFGRVDAVFANAGFGAGRQLSHDGADQGDRDRALEAGDARALAARRAELAIARPVLRRDHMVVDEHDLALDRAVGCKAKRIDAVKMSDFAGHAGGTGRGAVAERPVAEMQDDRAVAVRRAAGQPPAEESRAAASLADELARQPGTVAKRAEIAATAARTGASCSSASRQRSNAAVLWSSGTRITNSASTWAPRVCIGPS